MQDARVSVLAETGMLTPAVASELVGLLRGGADVMICGPTGSGKTTLLRALLEAAEQPGERIAWIGPGAPSGRPDTLALSAAGGVASAGALVRSAQRMGAARIVVDDIGGEEALELLGVMGGGGCTAVCTIAASSVDEALDALVDHAARAPGASPAGARALLTAAAPVVVELLRPSNGRRAVSLIRGGA